MLTIVIASIGVAAAFGAGFAFVNSRVDVSSSSSWPFGAYLVGVSPSARPRGVQEEDLPPFVFRDRPAPVHPPVSTPVRLGRTARVVG